MGRFEIIDSQTVCDFCEGLYYSRLFKVGDDFAEILHIIPDGVKMDISLNEISSDLTLGELRELIESMGYSGDVKLWIEDNLQKFI